MWKLVNLTTDWNRTVNLDVYDLAGAKTQITESRLKKDDDRRAEIQASYRQEVVKLLKDGWEPFNIVSNNNTWFRMKVEA